MPRPELDLGPTWKKELVKRAEERIEERLEDEPLTEDEIWVEVVRALGGDKGVSETARRLRRLYNLEYRKKISNNTSNITVISNLKGVAKDLKKNLLKKGYKKTKRIIQFGKKYYGVIYYKDGTDVKEKVEKIILSDESTASDVLSAIQNKGFVFQSKLPFQKRLIDLAFKLLSSYGLAERKRYKGKMVIIRPGFDIKTLSLPSSGDISFWRDKNWDVKKNFYAGAWVLSGSGPKVTKFKFDIVAFDPENFQLHIADISKKRAGLSELKALKRKKETWGLSAVMHFLAPSFTESAISYADRWGIFLSQK